MQLRAALSGSARPLPRTTRARTQKAPQKAPGGHIYHAIVELSRTADSSVPEPQQTASRLLPACHTTEDAQLAGLVGACAYSKEGTVT